MNFNMLVNARGVLFRHHVGASEYKPVSIGIIMRLILFLTLAFTLPATADVVAQRVSLSVTNTPLKQVLQELRKQTGYSFIYSDQDVVPAAPVTLQVDGRELLEVLPLVFQGQHLAYTVSGKVISIIPATEPPTRLVFVQEVTRGKVVDTLGNGLGGASVRVLNAEGKRTSLQAITDREGKFVLHNVPEGYHIEVSYIGYRTQTLMITGQLNAIALHAMPSALEEVEVMVNTGYQTLPKERATGSFSVIDQRSIERSAGPDLIARLEGLAEGLQFHRTIAGERGENLALRVRGLSTIMANESPLIVVDNFPYDGDLNAINPNDVESVTILKDGAAASIWGARAGNGVIVIKTKSVTAGQPSRFDFKSTVLMTPKPDLYYDQSFLTSSTVMEIEKALYETGRFYYFTNRNPNPYYVELLEMRRNGAITDEEFANQERVLRHTDTRTEALKYFYRNAISQQYAASLSGGTDKFGYRMSAGLDGVTSRIVGDGQRRLTASVMNYFKPIKHLELTAGLDYLKNNQTENGRILRDLLASGTHGIAPYTRFVDDFGNAVAMASPSLSLPFMLKAESTGLLDWTYRPLDALKYETHESNQHELRFRFQASYKFLEKLRADLAYQVVNNNSTSEDYYTKESFYVRDLVNRYTQDNFQQIIPYGGILQMGAPSKRLNQTGRLQLNYEDAFQEKHEVYVLAGMEIRESVFRRTPALTIYNYDPETLTGMTNKFDYNQRYPLRPDAGTGVIPHPGAIVVDNNNRFLSYFGNASYHYRRKYIVSGSLRWDASNLLGVKTNQRGIPLWSLGGSWQLDKESFFNIDKLSTVRLRATYGSSGNLDHSVSSLPIMLNPTINTFDLPNSRVQNPGNPSLRWEKVETINVGVDAASAQSRVALTVEYFQKNATDLLGMALLPPSVGTNSWSLNNVYKINYADVRTQGFDVRLTTKNIVAPFSWQSTFTFSKVKDEIVNYYNPSTYTISNYLSGGVITSRPLKPGISRDALYAIPWNGLRSDNGLPIIDEGMSYADFYRTYPLAGLQVAGVTVAPYYGAIQNSFSWKQFELHVLINWYTGHVFRKKSMSSGREFFTGSLNHFHQDYYKRWQQPGDERITDVPAAVAYGQLTNAELNAMANYYTNSTALIRSADHVRLQNVQLRYVLDKATFRRLPIRELAISAYGNNLGLLWTANSDGLDPIAPNAVYPASSQWSLGLQVSL